MRLNTADAVFLVGDAAVLEAMPAQAPLAPFDPAVLDFFDALSRSLLARPETKRYPDAVSFGFWCRRACLREQAARYADGACRVGRGMALHIAPGNVPMAFAYSLAAGLLSGNAGAVRLSSADFPQAGLVCEAVRSLLDGPFRRLRAYAACLRYPRESGLTAELSALCDARIVWGGDETVRRIRALPLGPRAVEVCFADRWSVCAVESGAYLAADDRERIARDFYLDTYYNHQAACTAPGLVLWLGGRAEEARADFWPRLERIARAEYRMSDALAVRKREAFCRLAAEHPEIRLCPGGNLLVRAWVPELFPALMEFRTGGGFFFETAADSLDALLPVCGEKCQTVAQYGVEPERFRRFLRERRPKGVDRVVPVGRTMEFSLLWDGYDLIRSLSRTVDCGLL